MDKHKQVTLIAKIASNLSTPLDLSDDLTEVFNDYFSPRVDLGESDSDNELSDLDSDDNDVNPLPITPAKIVSIEDIPIIVSTYGNNTSCCITVLLCLLRT